MKKPNRERAESVMKPLCSTTPTMAQVPERNNHPSSQVNFSVFLYLEYKVVGPGLVFIYLGIHSFIH